MIGRVKRDRMVLVAGTFAGFVCAVFASACATTSEARWRDLPRLAEFSSADEVRSEISKLYDPSRFATLVVVGNAVYGNPCATPPGSTGVAGGQSATGVEGGSSTTGVEGATSTTGVSGGSSTTGVAGATSPTTGVTGDSSTTGVTGGSSTTGVEGSSGSTGVMGGTNAVQCTAGGGPSGYLIRVPTPAAVLEFDGSALRPVPGLRIRR